MSQHTLLQHIAGLTSLRALHTIQFRNDDACNWVMREFKKFTVDNVSHNPDMKLEFLAVDLTVERLVRRKPTPGKSKPKADKKGKGKAIDGADCFKPDTMTSIKALAEMVIGGPNSSWAASSDGIGGGSALSVLDWESSCDEEEVFGVSSKTGLKIETVEGIRFCDVPDVKIFTRECLDGRL